MRIISDKLPNHVKVILSREGQAEFVDLSQLDYIRGYPSQNTLFWSIQHRDGFRFRNHYT